MSDEAIASLRASTYPIDEGGIGGARGSQPEGYWFKLAGRRATALGYLATRRLHGDSRPARLIAKAWFSEPESTTPKASRCAWLGFEVAWSWGVEKLVEMYPHMRSEAALVSHDLCYGIAIDNHVGYLPWELSDEETIYQVARWYPPEREPEWR
jgi:hypothetical protein